MKKLLFCALAGAIGFAGAKAYEHSQKKEVEVLLLQNIEALAQINHEGGLANKRCPIWNVSYTVKTGVLPSTEVTCTTGGSWKCEAGKCPHEK